MEEVQPQTATEGEKPEAPKTECGNLEYLHQLQENSAGDDIKISAVL